MLQYKHCYILILCSSLFLSGEKTPVVSSEKIPALMYSLTVKDIALGINRPKTINLTDLVNLSNNLSHVSLGKPV